MNCPSETGSALARAKLMFNAYLLLIYSTPGSEHGHIVSVENGTDIHYHNYQQFHTFLSRLNTPNLKCYIISPHILKFMAHKVVLTLNIF